MALSEARYLSVTIDGPSGSGKSSVARAVASALGFTLVDTGSLYRGLAFKAIHTSVDLEDGAALTELAANTRLHLSSGALLVDGVDRSTVIRQPDISEAASRVSKHPEVRQALLGLQRSFAMAGPVVLEGRDTGTVVLPNADLKVFLTATDKARAQRRHEELQRRGRSSDLSDLLSAMRRRDTRDSTRDVAPLIPAPDAVHIDSTKLSLEEVIAKVVRLASSLRK